MPDFPQPGFPVIFADFVMSAAQGNGIVKYYLGRIDPDIFGGGESNPTAIAQVAMPIESFAQAVFFFLHALESYVEQGHITEARYIELKRLASYPGESD